MTQIIAEPPFIKELKRLAKKYKNITKDIQKLAEFALYLRQSRPRKHFR